MVDGVWHEQGNVRSASAIRYKLYAIRSLLLFQLLLDQFRSILSGQQHRAEGGTHSWGAIYGGDGQSDDEAIGIYFAGTVHDLFFGSRNPHSAVSRDLIIQVPFVKELDQDCIMAGGVNDDLALKGYGIDMDDIMTGHLGGGAVDDDAFQ